MDLVIQCVTKKYATFSGRARRKEYWLLVLATTIVAFVLGFIDGFVGLIEPNTGYGFLGSLFSLAVLLPSLAVGVRRLHDTDRSGWWMLIIFIPFLGAIWLIVLFCLKGTEGENRFGPDPLAGADADGAVPQLQGGAQ